MAVLPSPAPGCESCSARDAVIADQARVLEEQAAAIGELRADVVALAAEVRDLRRRLGRNSGNSSMAPSADDLPGRTPPPAKPKRGKGGRQPGGQPGAPGSHLAWSGSPDERVPHFPAGACACGADLGAAADLGVAASHQVVDIPLETATVTQHDLHEVACRCGRVHRAGAPAEAGVAGTVTYGLALQAWCVYLIVAHAIPVHRCAELVEALTGAEPSPGSYTMPTLYRQLKKLPWASIPAVSSVTAGYGRRARRTIKAALAPAWIEFDGAAQVAQLRRTVTSKGKKTVEVVYLITSDPDAAPATLAAWVRGHWEIENCLHWVRDVTYQEDKSLVRTGNAPRVMATLRSLAISLLRLDGHINIAAANRYHARDPQRTLKLLQAA